MVNFRMPNKDWLQIKVIRNLTNILYDTDKIIAYRGQQIGVVEKIIVQLSEIQQLKEKMKTVLGHTLK